MKVLIVKTSSMGDIIHALPVAYDIARARPDVTLHWLAEESFADVAQLSGNVARVHRCAFRRWRKRPFAADVRREVAELKASLRAERFDLVIDLQGLMRSALAARWAGAPVHGFSFSCVREPVAALAYAKRYDWPEAMGAVARYRALAASALDYAVRGAPRFALCARAKPAPECAAGPFVAAAVNTSRDEKLWPQAYWVELCRSLRESEGLRTLFFWGNEAERARVEAIARAVPDAVVLERLTLDRVAATLSQAVGLVGVDTGISHLAAAMGRPSVGIFVSTKTDWLKLIGDGPVESLGDVGVTPSVADVRAAFDAVRAREEHCS